MSSESDLVKSMECVEVAFEPFANDLYAQMTLKAKQVSDDQPCEWSFEMKHAESGDFLRFKFIVRASEECAKCPIGQQHVSTAECNCVEIPTIPVEGRLFQAHEYELNTEHIVEMRSGDMVTFRAWSVDGKFPYDMDMSSESDLVKSMECVEVAFEPFANELYAQMTLKAKQVSDDQPCEWSFEMRNAESGDFLRFKFVVRASEGCAKCPLGQQHVSTAECNCVEIPTIPVEGRLFQAHEYELNTEHIVEMRSGDMVTFRVWSVDGKFP
jgi:uncharacterized protein YfcZ (UPF0381/DUF406 family)